MDQAEFEQKFGYVGRKKPQHGNGRKSKELVKHCLPSGQCCSPRDLAQRAIRLLPIIGWLPRYSPRKYLHCDLITGLTVGIMVVPQGMAYATLAKVAPVYGLYSCFFAAFFYMFFGTSPHVSIGTFAVASMMVGNVRSELVPDPVVNGLNGTGHEEPVKGPIDFGYPVTPIMLTSALTFGVGICQLLMALCRLSFLTNYISDPLVSGFTTGAAIHVLTSQMEKLIGIKIKSYHGPGMIIFMWRDLILKAKNANIWTLCISAVGLAFLSLGRDYVIAAIIFSTLLGFKKNYGVKIVDHVPDGMPLPALPQLDLLPHIWIEAVSISIICYVFVFSLSKIFAKKHKYKVDANQELCAIGICSVLSSFFPVYPFGASLSRSSLCEMTGAKTPLHALFSSALLLVVILWIGPLLEPLPMAILACIVAVSLKPLFLQFKELARLWRISIYDFAIWLVAFAATALLDITYGLAISVLFSIFTVVLKEQWPNFKQMGEAKPGIFRPLNLYTDLSNPTSQRNIQIWRLDAPLHFANAPKLIESVAEICQQIASTAASDSMTDIKIVSNDSSDLKLHNESSSPQSVNSRDSASDVNKYWKQTDGIICSDPNSSKPLLHQSDTDHGTNKPQQNEGNSSRSSQSEAGTKGALILDCAAVSHIDAVGVDAIQEMYKDANRLGVALKFAAFSDSILAIFHRCSLFQQVPGQNFFPSIQDALTSTIL